MFKELWKDIFKRLIFTYIKKRTSVILPQKLIEVKLVKLVSLFRTNKFIVVRNSSYTCNY